MDVLKRVNRELDQEMCRQVDLIYSAAAIAFARYWDNGSLAPCHTYQPPEQDNPSGGWQEQMASTFLGDSRL